MNGEVLSTTPGTRQGRRVLVALLKDERGVLHSLVAERETPAALDQVEAALEWCLNSEEEISQYGVKYVREALLALRSIREGEAASPSPWRTLEQARAAKRPPTAAERTAAHEALDRMLDRDPALTLWLLTRSRVAVEDALDATESR